MKLSTRFFLFTAVSAFVPFFIYDVSGRWSWGFWVLGMFGVVFFSTKATHAWWRGD